MKLPWSRNREEDVPQPKVSRKPKTLNQVANQIMIRQLKKTQDPVLASKILHIDRGDSFSDEIRKFKQTSAEINDLIGDGSGGSGGGDSIAQTLIKAAVEAFKPELATIIQSLRQAQAPSYQQLPQGYEHLIQQAREALQQPVEQPQAYPRPQVAIPTPQNQPTGAETTQEFVIRHDPNSPVDLNLQIGEICELIDLSPDDFVQSVSGMSGWLPYLKRNDYYSFTNELRSIYKDHAFEGLIVQLLHDDKAEWLKEVLILAKSIETY